MPPLPAFIPGLFATMSREEANLAMQVDLSAWRLARNTALNLVGQIVPLVVAVAAMPYVVRHLGPDRFGLLSLAWMVVGYFGLFDLGIGPATTKFVAELLGKGEIGKLPELVWSALASQTAFGLAAGVVLALGSPLLVDQLLKIPAELHPQAHLMLLILAAALPIDFASGSMRGVLAATQRFDLLNALTVPASSLNYLLPVVALALGFGLPAIVLFLVLARLASLAVLFALCFHLYPALRAWVRFDPRLVRRLLGFGGWVSVSSVLAPILTNFEKFAVATLLSVGALTYYIPCYTMISKVAILPGALATSLFPAFSYCGAKRGNSHLLQKLSVNPVRYILLLMAPVTIVFILFGNDILRIWLGADFSRHSATIFKILALVFFVHAFAYVPLASVNGLGHPEWKAKLDLVEAPLFMALCWILTLRMGLVGVALAKFAVTLIDVVCLFVLSKRLVGFSFRDLTSSPLMKSFAVACIPIIGGLPFAVAAIPLGVELFVFAVSLAFYALATWKVAFDDQDRLIVSGSIQRLTARKDT
jgi:O-antigen/teichoic acid export membrane protein